MPPKRNFIKENVQRLKDAQQMRGLCAAAATTSTVERTIRSAGSKNAPQGIANKKIKATDMRIKVIKEPPQQFDQGDNSTSALICDVAAQNVSDGPDDKALSDELISLRREMGSQTGDISDELFLKDVIIRLV